ncbi:MAG: hypothetical protein EOO39_47340 [Cytophagaceae bacterium]|nr:MAG: hypothetical protein EOO39_47340 [Cytophagaceae bacterium]
MKIMMLRELNAIINMHPALDKSFIPAALIQPISADLRIVLDYNQSGGMDMTVREPGKHLATQKSGRTKNGGLIYTIPDYYYGYSSPEYQLDTLRPGKYLWVP